MYKLICWDFRLAWPALSQQLLSRSVSLSFAILLSLARSFSLSFSTVSLSLPLWCALVAKWKSEISAAFMSERSQSIWATDNGYGIKKNEARIRDNG